MTERLELVVDGERLVGVLHRANDVRGTCIVACHGFAANKDGAKYLGLADACNRNAMDLVRFDFRGCGESEGDIGESSPSKRLVDVKAVIDHVEGLGYGKIGLFGSSMGGYVALIHASTDPRIKAIVCIASPYSMVTLVKLRLEKRGPTELERYGIGQDFLRDMKENDAYLLEAFLDINAPTLVIHGGKDTVVSRDQADYIYKRLRCEKRFELIEDGDHVFGDQGHLEKVIGMASSWFKDHI